MPEKWQGRAENAGSRPPPRGTPRQEKEKGHLTWRLVGLRPPVTREECAASEGVRAAATRVSRGMGLQSSRRQLLTREAAPTEPRGEHSPR